MVTVQELGEVGSVVRKNANANTGETDMEEERRRKGHTILKNTE